MRDFYAPTFGSFSELYPQLINELIVRSPEGGVAPRGLPTVEMADVHMKVLDPWKLLQVEGRQLAYGIGALEACSLVGQYSNPDRFIERFKNFQPFVSDGVLWGAYGPRVAGNLGEVVRLLQSDPYSRQAILTIFDSSRDLNRNVPDVPCTISIQFLRRFDMLNMIVNMRSNDVWLGFPYDSIQFSALMGAVAQSVGATWGWYSHNVGSMHLYERDREKAVLIKPAPTSGLEVGLKFWGADTIAEISARARGILEGYAPKYMTQFERLLFRTIHVN